MSARHTTMFIPSQTRHQQPANLSPAHIHQPPPPPEIKPYKPSENFRDSNGFKIPRYVRKEEPADWEQDCDALAMWAMENLGEAPPSLESLKDGVTPILQRQNPDEIQKIISQRSEEHEDDLRKLYGYQAHLREELLREHRRVTDGGDFYPVEEIKSSKEKNRPIPPLFYAQCNKELDMQTREFNDVVERFMYAHQQAHLRLQDALSHAKVQSAEAESKRKWDEDARQVALNTRFPQTIEAYDQITNPNHKLRVSRLLVAPTTEEKEQIAEPFPGMQRPENWTEGECKALMGIFRSDPPFAEKVQRYIQNLQSTDPRRRPTV